MSRRAASGWGWTGMLAVLGLCLALGPAWGQEAGKAEIRIRRDSGAGERPGDPKREAMLELDRRVREARREVQILEARLALKRAELQKVEAELMLLRLGADGPDRADRGDESRPRTSELDARPAVPNAQDQSIFEALKRPIVMPFPDATSLEDVLKYIRSTTRGDRLPNGVPIIVDRPGLMRARQSLESKVRLKQEDIPLKEALKLILKPLGLTYVIDEGRLLITAPEADRPKPE